MRYLPDGIQMKNADEYTIKQLGVPSLVLMERAALETVRQMHKHQICLEKALIVCGSGNNGGDGFAIARLLKEQGFHSSIFFVGKESSLSEECAVQKQIVKKMNIPVFTDFPEGGYTVIVDAVFGVGLSRVIEGKYRDVISWMNEQNCQKVAVDIPSGICSKTGDVLGIAFQADITVSMACVKIGCELFPGKNFAGKTIAVPIGIATDYFLDDTSVCYTCDREDLKNLIPKRKKNSHKGTYGKVLMITGSEGMSGAAFLSARASYEVGAGLVQIYTPESNRIILQQLLPEAIISTYEVRDDDRGVLKDEQQVTSKLESLIRWADCVCIGCGLGESEASKFLLHSAIKHLKKEKIPSVIDADGLNLLSENTQLLKDLERVIITPHMKEMSRLVQKEISQIAENKKEILQQFTEEYSVICVLKDSRTFVAEREKRFFLNLAGNSAMAKAGSGDVLAGVITGLLAQHMDRYDAAVAGVYLHACGGDEARRQKGAYSVLATDLIDGVGMCLKGMEEIH